MERFERVRSYVLAHPALFASQGSVAATWRTYRGRRLGPYFQVSWRESGRQRWLYLGRSQELADRVGELLARRQHGHRQRRLFARLKRQARSAYRRWKVFLRQLLAGWGIQMKGFEFRGSRRALPRYVEAIQPYQLARPPNLDRLEQWGLGPGRADRARRGSTRSAASSPRRIRAAITGRVM